MPVVHKSDGAMVYWVTKRTTTLAEAITLLRQDDNIEEIVYNGPTQPLSIYHKQNGFLPTNINITEQEARAWINTTTSAARATLSENNPLYDGSLPDGSRVNITIPPASPQHSTITIRTFKRTLITVLDLIKTGTLDTTTAAFIWTLVDGLGSKPANIIVTGGTGTGKTTLLNALTHFIPANQRIVTIEDTAELQLLHTNKAALLSRKDTNLTMDKLLVNALRMRPDRIIVGEVRGPEAITLFEALNTGHQGSLGTLHAESAREAITRITNPPLNVPPALLSALDMIIVLNRVNTPSGPKRVISEISETTVVSGGEVRFNVLRMHDPVSGTLKPTGIPSKLRTTISTAVGVTPKDLDLIIEKRAEILEQATKRTDLTPWYLFHELTRIGATWREMLNEAKKETGISKWVSRLLRRR